MVTLEPEVDQARAEAFAGRVLQDATACMVTALAALGDRLDLFKDLAANGPASSAELAARTATNPRYLREWLGGMAAAGYLTYDPTSSRFSLPAEHVPTLAQEGGPFFAGGPLQLTIEDIQQLGRVEGAFRSGGGVAESDYGDEHWKAQQRYSAGWVNNLLTQIWIPAMPAAEAKLQRGTAVADVGCGRGLALIKLAQAYPNSYGVGYDRYAPEVEQATRNAQHAGVADRVRFQPLDASSGLPAEYDVITTFDVVHDSADPRRLLHAIRRALKPDGVYICEETNCSDKLEENLTPMGALFHAISIFYCLTTSLAHGGEGLGTLGLPEPKLRELCTEAGFSSVRRVPMNNPFNALYEIRP